MKLLSLLRVQAIALTFENKRPRANNETDQHQNRRALRARRAEVQAREQKWGFCDVEVLQHRMGRTRVASLKEQRLRAGQIGGRDGEALSKPSSRSRRRRIRRSSLNKEIASRFEQGTESKSGAKSRSDRFESDLAASLIGNGTRRFNSAIVGSEQTVDFPLFSSKIIKNQRND